MVLVPKINSIEIIINVFFSYFYTSKFVLKICKLIQINQPKRCNNFSVFITCHNRPDHDQQHCYHQAPTAKRLLLQLMSS